MKPINEMNLEELAEYAVTLDGWEWMPGMRTLAGGIVLFDQKVAWNDDVYWFEVVDHADPNAKIPDLNDPATLGCVLAMARKRHGGLTHIFPQPTTKVWVVMVEEFVDFGIYRSTILSEEMPSEAHALIAALAKEVGR